MTLSDERAEAILRGRLTRAQNADVDLTGWFNVRDAYGRLWRVWAGVDASPEERWYPNLVDWSGQGRTMMWYAYRLTLFPPADLALAVLLWLADDHLAYRVSEGACSSPARSITPLSPELKSFYRSYGERNGGGPLTQSRWRRRRRREGARA